MHRSETHETCAVVIGVCVWCVVGGEDRVPGKIVNVERGGVG